MTVFVMKSVTVAVCEARSDWVSLRGKGREGWRKLPSTYLGRRHTRSVPVTAKKDQFRRAKSDESLPYTFIWVEVAVKVCSTLDFWSVEEREDMGEEERTFWSITTRFISGSIDRE